MLFEKFVEQCDQCRFGRFFRGRFDIVLLRIVILFQSLFQPLFLRFCRLSGLIGSFEVGFEFSGFIVVIGTHFVVANDFAFDLFGLVIPKIGVDGEPGRCDHIYLPAIPQTRVNGCFRFCIIVFYALFDDESYFHSTQIPD